MLQTLSYGTYLFFGLLTFLGAAFIYFFFPETKGLSLEEMDLLFGSAGYAAADEDRLQEIKREVGLVDFLQHRDASGDTTSEKAHAYQREVKTSM